jgi:hypothetical protein
VKKVLYWKILALHLSFSIFFSSRRQILLVKIWIWSIRKGVYIVLYTSHNELTVIRTVLQPRRKMQASWVSVSETTANLLVDLKFTYAIINQSDDSQGVRRAGIDRRPVSASLWRHRFAPCSDCGKWKQDCETRRKWATGSVTYRHNEILWRREKCVALTLWEIGCNLLTGGGDEFGLEMALCSNLATLVLLQDNIMEMWINAVLQIYEGRDSSVGIVNSFQCVQTSFAVHSAH